ncbi:MAG: hypothetical protein J6Y92_05695 [Lentisphaeria bacterium]|nr:hypothetical protein [Lentisphaeria bacterium]
MKLFSFAAAVCLPVFLFLCSSAFAQDAPERRTIPELTLKERIEDLLDAVEDESPEIYRRINELSREDALARIMRALDSGVVPASSTEAKSPDVQFRESDFRKYPVFGVTERAIPYVRLDLLSASTVSQSVRELEKMAGESAPAGVIVDLRETAAGDDAGVKTLSKAVGKLKCPVMALVSGRTFGKGELLAAVLRRDRGALLLGTETAGNIFPLKRIVVNDVKWFVPDPPAEYYDISPYAIKPDLEKQSDVRLSFDELKEKPNKLDGDPVLRLAADLLILKAAVRPVEQSPAQ